MLPSGYSPSMLAIDWWDEHNCYDNYLVESLAWLLRLAQAAYNKNRTSRSTIDTSKYGLPVQSLAKIENLLKTQDAKLRQYFSLSHWATWKITIYELNTHVNLQSGSLTVTQLDDTTTTMDYDTPSNLWIEWQMLNRLANYNYHDSWSRNEIFSLSGLADIPQTP